MPRAPDRPRIAGLFSASNTTWCPNYRRPVLTSAVETRLAKLILQSAASGDELWRVPDPITCAERWGRRTYRTEVNRRSCPVAIAARRIARFSAGPSARASANAKARASGLSWRHWLDEGFARGECRPQARIALRDSTHKTSRNGTCGDRGRRTATRL
jgi:hypothetical protein